MSAGLMDLSLLYNFISPVYGRILCDTGYVLVGDDRGVAMPSATISINNLPNLTHKKIWLGDPDNRPVEADPPKGEKGEKGDKGDDGDSGLGSGSSGLGGLGGLGGLAGLGGLGGLRVHRNSGRKNKLTFTIGGDIDLSGNSLYNIAQSPLGDYDAVSARWVWDLLHDNVIIQWESR